MSRHINANIKRGLRLELIINVFLMIAPIVLGVILSIVKNLTNATIVIVWAICLAICFLGLIKEIKRRKKEQTAFKKQEYYLQSQERMELFSCGLPPSYVDSLGENPLAKHSYILGQSYEKESNFLEAISEYQKCLSHPNLLPEDEIAFHILIGKSYLNINILDEAEKSFRTALKITSKSSDKKEIQKGKAVALNNLAYIYRRKRKLYSSLKMSP